jgi:uroporphyrin-III C-methyltransferase / precorrin-2 dehydrogenase / sirohydrochlorin ferrochelatase
VTGHVALVGAGPGDPELLTLRAVKALAVADIVFYDALVAEAALAHAPRAQKFCVGKRARRPSLSQEAIHSLLVRAARRGKRVVRLKGGDPFVFGRGGEEALALCAAGIPFDVVPGVSSAFAAPGLAGIPVTHRSLSSALAVVSGHAESAWRPVLSRLEPGTATIVVLMGLRSRAAVARALLDRGWAAPTPAAVVRGASTENQGRWLGTLAELAAARPDEDDAGAPGTVVVGGVVALAGRLRPSAEPEAARSEAATGGRADAR